MSAQVIDLTNLTASEGFVIQGSLAGDLAGRSVSKAGDVNGDGIGDFIIGAPGADSAGDNGGEAYVIYGVAGATRIRLDLSALTTGDGFVIQGDAMSDGAGFSVSGAGDINGDGIDDVVVGSRYGDDGGSEAGEAYVIFGQAGNTRARIDLTGLSTSDGFIIQGDAAGDQAGFSVSEAGDVNGDGIDDLIVGARLANGSVGAAYVIYGKQGPTRSLVDLSGLAPSDGYAIRGSAAFDRAGASVSGAGDVNGDGIGDLIVGAYAADNGGIDSGNAYIVFGQAGSARTSINLATLSSVDGYTIQGDMPGDQAGISVSGAGDINGDGIDDMIVGARYGDDGGTNAGEAYVIFGKTGTTRTSLDLTTLEPSDGFIIRGDQPYDRVGRSVSAAGDINGDGIDDLIVGLPNASGDFLFEGKSYVIFGSRSSFGVMSQGRQILDLELLTVSQGLIIRGDAEGDQAGFSVSGAGDVNGDGIDDLLIGALNGDDGGLNAGEAYVLYGNRSFGVISGTDGTDNLDGTAGADRLNGLAGNDVLNGGAGADRMNGGTGNDIFIVDNAGDVVSEANGEGSDRVETVLSAYTLTANVEILEYTGAGAFNGTGNDLANIIVGRDGGDTLSGLDGDDNLGGEAGDDLLDGGNGNDRLTGGSGADTMNGGDGNDILVVDNAGDVANGGAGSDTVQIVAAGLTYVLAADVETVTNASGGALTITLNALANSFGGSAARDDVSAGDGADVVYGRGGNDALQGQGGNDRLFGEAGIDSLNGGDGDDMLYGGADTDSLSGANGNDTLYGEAGDDSLAGNGGIDQLFGGAGADSFLFFSGSTGTTLATADRIRDFSSAQGDRIDLSFIDAVSGGADDGFSFIGSDAFTGVAGQLRAVVSGSTTLVSGDVNGDGVADFLIRVDGVHALAAGDFVL